MKIVNDEDVGKFPEDAQVIWVCGSTMPPIDHPMYEQAMHDQCNYCRSDIVRNKSAPENVTFLCMTCSHLLHKAYVDSGETPEVVMRAKDKDVFVATHGAKGKDFDRLAKKAMYILKNGPRRK